MSEPGTAKVRLKCHRDILIKSAQPLAGIEGDSYDNPWKALLLLFQRFQRRSAPETRF